MVPSYKDHDWVVLERRPLATDVRGLSAIQIRVLEGEEWKEYWVPADKGNLDYIQYQEWLAAGNEPRIIF